VSEEAIEHVVRARLPWRTVESKTECGRDVDQARLITREDLLAKVRKQGQARAAMTTCMTCWETCQRHPGWEDSPSAVIARQATSWTWARTPESAQVDRELWALAALVAAHQEEYAALLAAQSQNDELRQRRLQRRRRS